MNRAALLAAVASASLWAWGAHAADRKLSDYDFNHNGRIDPGREAHIYALHKANPILAKYDDNLDGELNEAELKRLQADVNGMPTDPAALATIAATEDQAASREGLPIKPEAVQAKSAAASCPAEQRIFVRHDELELSAYTNNISAKEAKGASLSVTTDAEAHQRSAESHGVVSWLVTRTCLEPPSGAQPGRAFVSGAGAALFLQADGVRTGDDPTKDKSTLKAGGTGVLSVFSGPVFDVQYLSLSPYFQTDFETIGRAYGAQLAWEPYRLDWNLGGTRMPPSAPVRWFWQARVDGDWLHVDRPGHTGLVAGTDYAWLGGQLGLTLIPAPEPLDQKLKLFATWTYHRDVNNSRDARLYDVGAAWDLTADGSLSVGVDYTHGLDRDKLQELEKTVVSLNYKH